MPTAEMQPLSSHAAARLVRQLPSRGPRSPVSAQPELAPVPLWMSLGMVFLAATSLTASLIYMSTEERPPSPAYALDSAWAAASPLGLRPVEMPTVCGTCGRVESVALRSVGEKEADGDRRDRPASHGIRKRAYQLQLRMDDGQQYTVSYDRPLAVGTAIIFEHGLLRLAHG